MCVLVVVSACAPKAAAGRRRRAQASRFHVSDRAARGTAPAQASRVERGWQYLQLDDLRNAEREFAAALKQQPSFHPAEAGAGYSRWRAATRRMPPTRFERALRGRAGVCAGAGRPRPGLLELDRDGDALASFEAALKDPSLTDLRSRVDVLRFRATQDMLARAKAAAEARRWEEARRRIDRRSRRRPSRRFSIAIWPRVEQQAGQPADALEHYRRAVELDPTDARSLAAIGEILERAGRRVRRAGRVRTGARRSIPPMCPPAPSRGCAASRRPGEAARRSIAPFPANRRVTRARRRRAGRRAARAAARASAGRGRWSSPTSAATGRSSGSRQWCASGVMDTLPNYEFEPTRRVRRGELADTVSRLLSLIGVVEAGAGEEVAGRRAWRSTTCRPRT